jgi:hypothetical protein
MKELQQNKMWVHGRENCHIWVVGTHLPKVFAQPEDITHVDIT